MWPRTCLPFVATAAFFLTACPAVYPELKTPVRPAQGELEPPPPAELRWVAFKGATVPKDESALRAWGVIGSAAPNPYAVLLVNGKELLKTSSQSSTYEPTWPTAPTGNFWIRNTDKLRVELWNSHPVKDHPIGVRDLGPLDESAKSTGSIEVSWPSGAALQIAVEPAHARKGFGLSYDLRIGAASVTAVYEQCPAARAGIKVGDEILAVNGKLTSQMGDGELQTLFNSPKPQGLSIKLRHEDGKDLTVTLKEGSIYPLFSEDGPLR
jgi:hypothetical protein